MTQNLFKTHYKIIRNPTYGYTVQMWRIWFPFWIDAGLWNVSQTYEEAERYAARHATGRDKHYLGAFDDNGKAEEMRTRR